MLKIYPIGVICPCPQRTEKWFLASSSFIIRSNIMKLHKMIEVTKAMALVNVPKMVFGLHLLYYLEYHDETSQKWFK